MIELKNKKVLITGATGGIGGALVKKFLSLNADVLGTGTNLETESVVEDETVNEMEKSFTQEAVETQHETNTPDNVEEDVSNDLKEFGVDSDSPDLFSSETENSSPDDLLSSEEEDDLEIPAFLRRQKN